jgi:hypothetical protein
MLIFLKALQMQVKDTIFRSKAKADYLIHDVGYSQKLSVLSVVRERDPSHIELKASFSVSLALLK